MNALVANLEMHGKATFFDPRLADGTYDSFKSLHLTDQGKAGLGRILEIALTVFLDNGSFRVQYHTNKW